MRFGADGNPPNRFETLRYEPDRSELPPDEEPPDPAVRYLRDPARTLVATNQSPDLGFDASVNPYRGCTHACVYCLGPGTPVLRDDLGWTPLAELRVGDRLLAFDERGSAGRPRKLRTTVVLARWWSTRPTLRIVTAKAELLTTPDHLWLDHRARWRRSDRLTVGTRLRRLPVGRVPASDSVDDAYRAGYVAGITLGDGTMRFERRARRSAPGSSHSCWRVALRDREPLERLVAYLRRFGVRAAVRPFDPGPRSAPRMETVELRSRAALERVDRIVRREGTNASWRRGFVAGFFDAEGHHAGSLRVSQVDLAALARFQSCAREFGFEFKLEHRPGCASTARLVGPQAERFHFLRVFQPALLRKRLVFDGELLQTLPEPIRAIEPGPRRSVVDVQTSTGTFFAAGLCTHNCYARPTHEYLGFSAGRDFETRILVKERAPALLRRELSSRSWRPRVVALSGVTDPYQPIERKLRLTRGCLEVLLEARNPVAVVTKSRLVARDADLLAALARLDCAAVSISVTTLDAAVHRAMEPRAPRPGLRLQAIEALARAGVPVGVLVAPVVPGLTDHELPRILEAAARAGATRAAYVLLRLPHATREIFEAWLERHFPARRAKVLGRLRALRGGRLYDARYGVRQRGEGIFADQIAQLFATGVRRAGIANDPPPLSTAQFRRPAPGGPGQLALW